MGGLLRRRRTVGENLKISAVFALLVVLRRQRLFDGNPLALLPIWLIVAFYHGALNIPKVLVGLSGFEIGVGWGGQWGAGWVLVDWVGFSIFHYDAISRLFSPIKGIIRCSIQWGILLYAWMGVEAVYRFRFASIFGVLGFFRVWMSIMYGQPQNLGISRDILKLDLIVGFFLLSSLCLLSFCLLYF